MENLSNWPSLISQFEARKGMDKNKAVAVAPSAVQPLLCAVELPTPSGATATASARAAGASELIVQLKLRLW
nr:MAG: hypothetical protein [Microvirus sp.]